MKDKYTVDNNVRNGNNWVRKKLHTVLKGDKKFVTMFDKKKAILIAKALNAYESDVAEIKHSFNELLAGD